MKNTSKAASCGTVVFSKKSGPSYGLYAKYCKPRRDRALLKGEGCHEYEKYDISVNPNSRYLVSIICDNAIDRPFSS